MRKILIATPVRGNLPPRYVATLIELMGHAPQDCVFGHACVEGTPVNFARNALAQYARDSGFDEILWWDADLKPTAEQATKLLAHDVDIVAAPYPKKNLNTLFHVQIIPGIDPTATGLREASLTAIGFCKMKVSALKQIMEANPEFACTFHENGNEAQNTFNLFPMQIFDGHLFGEDFGFCKLAAKAGIKLYVDTSFVVLHTAEIDLPLPQPVETKVAPSS